MHDDTEEQKTEGDEEEEEEEDNNALIGDDVEQTLQFLVVSVVKAEGLPGFDKLLGGQGQSVSQSVSAFVLSIVVRYYVYHIYIGDQFAYNEEFLCHRTMFLYNYV